MNKHKGRELHFGERRFCSLCHVGLVVLKKWRLGTWKEVKATGGFVTFPESMKAVTMFHHNDTHLGVL